VDNIQVSKEYPAPDVSQLHQARSFADVNEFFDVLKAANIRYVVMRNWDALPDIELGGNSDLDILVLEEDLPRFYAVSGVITPNALLSIRLCLARIADSYLKIDVRSPLDGYLPSDLAISMLNTRKVNKNFFIPSKEMFFWSYLYHRVFQKPWISQEQVKDLLELSSGLVFLPDLHDLAAIYKLFESKDWKPTRPLDEWVWWIYRDNTKHYPEWKRYEKIEGAE